MVPCKFSLGTLRNLKGTWWEHIGNKEEKQKKLPPPHPTRPPKIKKTGPSPSILFYHAPPPPMSQVPIGTHFLQSHTIQPWIILNKIELELSWVISSSSIALIIQCSKLVFITVKRIWFKCFTTYNWLWKYDFHTRSCTSIIIGLFFHSHWWMDGWMDGWMDVC
jgi:hypothetical protein